MRLIHATAVRRAHIYSEGGGEVKPGVCVGGCARGGRKQALKAFSPSSSANNLASSANSRFTPNREEGK